MNNQPNLGSIHGQFSSSLRGRSMWKVLGPVLTAQATALHGTAPVSTLHPYPHVFMECPLPGYDFNLFLGNSSQPLHVILLTSSSLSPDNKDHTLSRLSDFSTSMLSSPGRSIIGLLLSEQPFQSATGKYNLDALLTLRILMMENLSVSIPVLPIPDSSSFFESVHEYLSNLADIPAQDPSTADSINLLSHTSSGDAGFLSEHDRNVLSDLFPSLKVMSRALQTQDGRDILCDYLGEEKAKGIVNFWANDSLNE